VLGRSTVVKTAFDAIQPPVVSSSTICSATLIGKGSIVINGLVLGTAQVSVASDGQPKDVATYEVHVVRDRDYFVALATFINQHVPNCQQITLTLSPDTRKVLVGGYVWTTEAIRQIYDLLISPDLQQSDIINQMWWACPPWTGGSYPTH
jgi:Flp pilus assembly secretin CpaC